MVAYAQAAFLILPMPDCKVHGKLLMSFRICNRGAHGLQKIFRPVKQCIAILIVEIVKERAK